jgi:CheY-like chemotaxis protein
MCNKTGSADCSRVELKHYPVAVLIDTMLPLQRMDHFHVVVVLSANEELQGILPPIVVLEVSDGDSLE